MFRNRAFVFFSISAANQQMCIAFANRSLRQGFEQCSQRWCSRTCCRFPAGTKTTRPFRYPNIGCPICSFAVLALSADCDFAQFVHFPMLHSGNRFEPWCSCCRFLALCGYEQSGTKLWLRDVHWCHSAMP